MSEPTAMTPEREAAIRALVDRITPGTWITHGNGTCKCGMVWADGTTLVHAATTFDMDDVIPNDAQQVSNAAFIAAAPGMVRELLAEVERLRGERDTAASLNNAFRIVWDDVKSHNPDIAAYLDTMVDLAERYAVDHITSTTAGDSAQEAK